MSSKNFEKKDILWLVIIALTSILAIKWNQSTEVVHVVTNEQRTENTSSREEIMENHPGEERTVVAPLPTVMPTSSPVVIHNHYYMDDSKYEAGFPEERRVETPLESSVPIPMETRSLKPGSNEQTVRIGGMEFPNSNELWEKSLGDPDSIVNNHSVAENEYYLNSDSNSETSTRADRTVSDFTEVRELFGDRFFGPEEWTNLDIVIDNDAKIFPTIPWDMETFLEDCPFDTLYSKKVFETHCLYYVPKLIHGEFFNLHDIRRLFQENEHPFSISYEGIYKNLPGPNRSISWNDHLGHLYQEPGWILAPLAAGLDLETGGQDSTSKYGLISSYSEMLKTHIFYQALKNVGRAWDLLSCEDKLQNPASILRCTKETEMAVEHALDCWQKTVFYSRRDAFLDDPHPGVWRNYYLLRYSYYRNKKWSCKNLLEEYQKIHKVQYAVQRKKPEALAN